MRRRNEDAFLSGTGGRDPWEGASGFDPSERERTGEVPSARRDRTSAVRPMETAWQKRTASGEQGGWRGHQKGRGASPRRKKWSWLVIVAGVMLACFAFILGVSFGIFRGARGSWQGGWSGEGWSDWDDWGGDWDVETNEEANDNYSIAPYEGDSSALSITLHSREGLEELDYPELYERCLPSTVSLTVYAGDSAAYGSGVVLTEDGYILTCAHVIDGMERATVTVSDGTLYDALLVGSDEQTDLAVLKIEAQGLTAAQFGSSSDLRIGEGVCAIGDSLGVQFRASLSDGIVSGLNREVSSNSYAMVLIQTTAAVNSGNSGGALFNRYGQVVGIVNMKMSSSYGSASIDNMGLAIPSATVKDIVDTLAVNGSVSWAVLGISCYGVDTTMATMSGIPEGLWVTEIQEGSDCRRAGLLEGDIITAVNGQEIQSVAAFREATADFGVGDTVTLTVWRDAALAEEAQNDHGQDIWSGDESAEETREYDFAYYGDIEAALVSSDNVESAPAEE